MAAADLSQPPPSALSDVLDSLPPAAANVASSSTSLPGPPKRTPTDSPPSPPAKRLKAGPRSLAAEAYGLKGKRPTMEDAHAIHLDLHATVHQSVVPLEGGGKHHHHLTTELASRVDANLLGGLSRKAAVRFARRLASIRADFFAPDGTSQPPPRMAFLGIYDGHCGRRAADFCKKWLHLYAYFAVWKLHYDATAAAGGADAGSPSDAVPAPEAPGASAGGGSKPLLSFPRKDVERALAEAFQELDEAFLEEADSNNWNDGCTALCCLVIDNDLYCLSVGDSQGVIAVQKEGQMVHGLISGPPHKPTDKKEAKRIKDLKGFVQEGRLWGVLGVSRSIGDRKYKKAGVIPTPHFMKIDLGPALFLVLACDGLWDVYPVATVAQLVHSRLREGEPAKGVAQQLVKDAIHTRNSHDNVSLILATLQ